MVSQCRFVASLKYRQALYNEITNVRAVDIK